MNADKKFNLLSVVVIAVAIAAVFVVTYALGEAGVVLHGDVGNAESPLPPGCVYGTVSGFRGGEYVSMRVPVCAGQPTPTVLVAP